MMPECVITNFMTSCNVVHVMRLHTNAQKGTKKHPGQCRMQTQIQHIGTICIFQQAYTFPHLFKKKTTYDQYKM